MSKKKHRRIPSVTEQLSAGVPAQQVQYPDGRNPTNRRLFEDVVDDIRQATYSVIRLRPTGDGNATFAALGSGFFISRTAFLTCNHVVNHGRDPHRDGDSYRLVNSLISQERMRGGRAVEIPNTQAGTDIHFFPESDCAILTTRADGAPQRYVALSYRDIKPGQEIGIAGYPLPELAIVEHGGQRQLAYPGLIYRVAKGVATAVYVMDRLESPGSPPLTKVPVVEVNFLFVPGNSGGPIFDAQDGKVLGFVQGFRTTAVGRRLVNGPFPDLGAQAPDSYVDASHAIYSTAISVTRVRGVIESFGVSL